MKRYIVTIMAVVFAISSTEVHELIRLPHLVQHYLYHDTQANSMTIIDFLKIHYTANHPFDNDDDEDNKLPFKSDISIVTAEPAEPFFTNSGEAIFFHYGKKTRARHFDGIPVKQSGSIFHPPRTADFFV